MKYTTLGKDILLNNKKVHAFIINFLIAFISFVPFIVQKEGIFTLFGDFNEQQIPLMMLANEAIKSGNILWSWNIDIGSSFIGGTSFYITGSPFFYLTLLFSKNAIPYIIGWLYMLKYAMAGLFAFCYIERYCEDKKYAVIGSVLYAFSGFQGTNLIFHFHDIVALFPLLLIGLDKLILDKKKGFFACAVFLNAFLNFYFLIAEIVFLILYFLIRFSKEYGRRIFSCIWEGFLGVVMSMVIFLPTIAFNLQNPRIAVLLQRWKWFDFNGRYLLYLVRAFIFPSETMSHQSFISDQDFSSWSAYLPMVGIILVFCYLYKYNRTWITKLLAILTVFCTVPVLNSVFSLGSETNYHRWYYMMILIMSLASSIVLEKRKEFPIVQISMIVATFTVTLISLSFWWNEYKYKLIYIQDKFIWISTVCLFGIFVTAIFYKLVKNDTSYFRLMLVGISIFAIITTMSNCKDYCNLAKTNDTPGNEDGISYYQRILALEELKQEAGYRYESDDNTMNMAGGINGTGSFTTTVNGSIFEFYHSLDNERSSFTPKGQEGVKELLSAKYYITPLKQKSSLIQTIKVAGEKYYVYENKNTLPIGFTYNTYMLYDEYKKLDYNHRGLAMLKTLIIDKKNEKEVSKILRKYNRQQDGTYKIEDKQKILQEHQPESSTDFYKSKNKFGSTIVADMEKYAFYSVPYDTGWSAKVNGKRVSIIKINGLMAVPIVKGSNKIEFTYHNTYLSIGGILSLLAGGVWYIYMRKKRVEIA